MEISINNRTITISWQKVVYFGVIFAFILYLSMDLGYNTAFVDEAIYATVGEGILREIYWENAISWMGGYYIYPLIAAYINHQFGLAGIRFFSVICLVITGVMAGKITKQFASRTGEILTLLFFLFWANVLDLGQLGTYDAPSLAFMSISVYLAIRSRYEDIENKKILLILLSSIGFALSILTKYVALFFTPALILLIYNPQPRNKIMDLINKKAVIELFIWVLPIATILAVYVGLYFDPLLNFFTGEQSFQPSTIKELVQNTWTSMHIYLLGALFGIIYALIKKSGEKRWIAIALVIGGIAPLSYHFVTINIRSYWKHMVFSVFYLAPLLSWILVKIYRKIKENTKSSAFGMNVAQILISVTAILIATYLWSSFSKHWRFQRSWPSATPSLEYLSSRREPNDKILAEASSVYKFHMFTGFEDPASWSSTWYMEYDGKFGTEAMIDAIEDQYFDYVVLNDYFTKYINDQLRPHLQENYEVVFEDDYEIKGVYTQNTVVWAPRSKLTQN